MIYLLIKPFFPYGYLWRFFESVSPCKLLHESEWAFWYNVMMFSNSIIKTELILNKID